MKNTLCIIFFSIVLFSCNRENNQVKNEITSEKLYEDVVFSHQKNDGNPPIDLENDFERVYANTNDIELIIKNHFNFIKAYNFQI